MKDFEKFLTDLPKPDVEVPAFRAQLRRELSSYASRPPATGLRWALGVTGALAAALLVVAVLFVARPDVPAAIHAAVVGPAPVSARAPVGLQAGTLSVALPVADDRAFVESWTAEQGLPVSVGSVESEQLFSVRRFELTDGKRMLVFTELGEDTTEPLAVTAGTPAEVY